MKTEAKIVAKSFQSINFMISALPPDGGAPTRSSGLRVGEVQ